MRPGIAAVGALLLLALTAAPAMATTDRVDYSDQANPICASTNKQSRELYESVEAEIDRLYDKPTKNRKQARRIYKRIEQLENQLPFQFIGLYRSELEQLKAIAPPPGYEDTVARWLGIRGEIGDLYVQYVQIDQELEDSPGFHKRPSRKQIKRRQKRRANLERIQDQIVGELLFDSEVDLELGAKLGAAYCVTGADGEIVVSLIGDESD